MWQPAADQFIKFIRRRMSRELSEFLKDNFTLFCYSHATLRSSNDNGYYKRDRREKSTARREEGASGRDVVDAVDIVEVVDKTPSARRWIPDAP
jgi:hypothetical protein